MAASRARLRARASPSSTTKRRTSLRGACVVAHVERAVLADHRVDRPHARDVVAPARRPAGDRDHELARGAQPLERRVRSRVSRPCVDSVSSMSASTPRIAAPHGVRHRRRSGRSRGCGGVEWLTLRCCRADGRRRVRVPRSRRRVARSARHRQAALGAPPQHVVAGARPFLAHQVVDLARGQLRAEILAQVGGGPRIAEHRRRARAVPVRQRAQQRSRGSCRIAARQLATQRGGPPGGRSPPGSGASRVHGGLHRGKNGASSASACSASLRYVVILPPKIDSTGARPARRRARQRRRP